MAHYWSLFTRVRVLRYHLMSVRTFTIKLVKSICSPAPRKIIKVSHSPGYGSKIKPIRGIHEATSRRHPRKRNSIPQRDLGGVARSSCAEIPSFISAHSYHPPGAVGKRALMWHFRPSGLCFQAMQQASFRCISPEFVGTLRSRQTSGRPHHPGEKL